MFICTVIWWIYLKFTCIDITHIHTRLTVPTLKVQPARHPRSRRQRQEAASILLPCSQSQDEQKTKMFTNQIYNIIPIISFCHKCHVLQRKFYTHVYYTHHHIPPKSVWIMINFGDFWHPSCIKSHEWLLRCFEDPQPRLVPLGRCAHPTTSEISGWKIQWGHFFIFLQLGSMVAYKISSRNARTACRDQTCEQKFGMKSWMNFWIPICWVAFFPDKAHAIFPVPPHVLQVPRLKVLAQTGFSPNTQPNNLGTHSKIFKNTW